MVGKCVTRVIVGIAATGVAVPLMAQPVPAPNQPSQMPPGSGVNQPASPGGLPVKPPVLPRRVPNPAVQPADPQATSQDPNPDAAGEPQVAPKERAMPGSALPQRRFSQPSAGGMVSLNFNRADLIEIIHIIAQQLRLTYTIDPEVKGTVTINSAEPLRAEDLLPVFHQVLRMNGAVAVRTGNLYHIMPIKDGKGLARPVGQSREDSFAVQVIPVRFFAVAEMKRVLTPFLQPGGEIIENPRGNFLIVMDLPSNIQRLMEIADLIDVQVFAGTRMEIYQPKIASAEELAQEMTKVMQSFAASAPQAETFTAQFIALPRINQLLVISHSEAAWTYARRWLERIDVIAEGPGRRVFIYPVENGTATEFAFFLSQALGLPASGGTRSTATLQNFHRSTPGGTSPTGTSPFGTGRPSTTFGSGFGSGTMQQGQGFGAYATIPAPGQTTPPAAPPSIPAAPQTGQPRPPSAGPQAQRPEEQQRIVADPATNSLIIYGTAQEYQNIKNILKDLDAVARQVLMDVLVAEVTLTDDLRFGVDYQILNRNGDVRILGREFQSRGGIVSGILPAIPESGLTQFPSGVSGVIGTGNAIRAFINAFGGDSRFRVLSSPSILATDNRPARIQVGTEEPVPTGTITQTVGTIAESTSIQYRNTGRIVTIIPQVNSQGLVNLQILAEVSQRGVPVAVGPNDFPSFDVRQAETTAVVQDGETLVIGGIITDSKNRTRSGIPYLMDLPVLGRFFGRTVDEFDRTELIMLITPHVIRNREESRRVTEDFKKSLSTIRNELERVSKERERLQQKPLEEAPALPGPAGPVPSIPPAPTSSPAPAAPRFQPAPGATQTQTRFSPAHLLLESGNSHGPESGPARQSGSAPRLDFAQAQSRAMLQKSSAAQTGSDHETLALLSTVKRPPQQNTKPPLRVWTVQVASVVERRDADAIAARLRASGYEAYVVTAEALGKIWHRVRVGQFSEVAAANTFKESLLTPEFKQAYVVGN